MRPWRSRSSTRNLGHVAAHAERFDDALALHEEQLRIGRESGDARAEGNAHNNCGIILAILGRFDEALAASRRAAAVHRAAGYRFGAIRNPDRTPDSARRPPLRA